MSKSRQELILYIRKVEDQLKGLYGNTYAEVLKLATVRNAIESGAQFTWKGNPLAERQLSQQLDLLSNRASKAIYNGITGGWKEGESQVKDEILDRFGKKEYTKEVNNVLEDAVKQQRKEGVTAHTFANEKRGGLNVSGRVWNLAGNAKKELEVIIQNGILEGKSADEVTKGLKNYLNEPDRLYRRVKNKETGELELSKAAKSYHPGRGVYRSAYKNALRLAITEINAAYRRAEWQSYQTNPLIVGYRIELSNNHTHVVNGKVRTLYDICDEMVGQYPKTFLWTGWHPHCRCRMVPILISDADFKARQQARKAGKLNEWRPKDSVSKPPKGFYNWLKDNKQRIATAQKKGSLPYFLQDNKRFTSSKRIKTPEQIKEIQSRWNKRVTGNKHNDHLKEIQKEYGGLSNAINAFISTIQSEIKAGASITKVNGLVSKLNHKVQVKQAWDIYSEEKRLSTLLVNVKDVKGKFGLEATQAVFNAVESKLKEWEGLTLEQQKNKLEFEVGWVNKTKKYDTWEVAESAYKKQLANVEYKIAKQEVLAKSGSLFDFAKGTKSTIVKDLAAELKALLDKDTPLSELTNKTELLNKEVARIEQQRLARLQKKQIKSIKGLDESAYTKARKDNALWAKTDVEADDNLRSKTIEVWASATDEERRAAFHYTEGSGGYNRPLRGYDGGWKPYNYKGIGKVPLNNEGRERYIGALEKLINKSSYNFDTWVQRGVDTPGVAGFLGIDQLKYSRMNQGELQALIGKTITENAFTSCGSAKGCGFNYSNIINIYCPKGTKMIYTEPFSHYGGSRGEIWDGQSKGPLKSELETLIQRGTTFRITKVERTSGITFIDMEVVAQ